MTLTIDCTSKSFPSVYAFSRSDYLTTSWDELLWAAITIGRPNIYHVFRHGAPSFHEAIFRLSLIRMAVAQTWHGTYLWRTAAFSNLDPTEKGMVSYFVGMTLCKLFASRMLSTPWLLHLDVFRSALNPTLLGRSRPDLVGEDNSGDWFSFESKGRSSIPSHQDKAKAKAQAQRLVRVGGKPCKLNVASFAYFRADLLEFYWEDPDPTTTEPIEVPRPQEEWRYYFEPALSLASIADDDPLKSDLQLADISVAIHPKIESLLRDGQWLAARELAREMRDDFMREGYHPDGIRVTAGQSWSSVRTE